MKKLLKILAGITLLLIVAAVIAPMFISADTLKTKVAEELSKATGRKLTIDGNASLKLFPDIAISLEKVTLGNPAGNFHDDTMFSANKLETGVRLMPLLNKEIIITGVTLDGAIIHLEETGEGVKNWEFASKASSETKQEKTAEGSQKSTFAIGDINVLDSMLSYRKPAAQPIELKNIDLTLSGADGSEPLALDGTAEYKNEQISLGLDLKDSRGFLGGKASPVVADIALPGGKFHFSGDAQQKEVLTAKGEVNVDIDSLPSMLQWVTGKPQAATIPKNIGMGGTFTLNDKRLNFSSIKLKADNLTATGKLGVDLSDAVPSLNGNLHLTSLDTAQFTKSTADDSSKAPAAGGDGWSSEPMDLSGLKAVNAKLSLQLDSIKHGKLDIGASALDVNLQDGRLNLGIEKMALYQGNAKGTIGLSPAGLITDLDITGVQIEPLLEALNGSSRLSGTAALNINVKGSGASQKALVSSLDGTLKMMFRDGAVKGINLGQFLRDARKGFFFNTPSEKTDFAELGGSFNFANGIGTTSDLAMKAPVLRLTGSGTVNLPNRSLNLKLLPSLVASTKGQDGKDKSGITIPLAVTGNWSNPSVTPDVRSMVEETLKDPAAAKQNLKNLKEGIKDFNSLDDLKNNLLGGKKEVAPAPAPATETAPTATPPAPAAAAPAPAPAPDPKQQAIESLFNAIAK